MKKSVVIGASAIGIAAIGAGVAIPVINNNKSNDSLPVSGNVSTQVSSEQQTIKAEVKITGWKPVGEYTNNEELRTTWENMLVITKDASGEKTGAFYTGKGNDVTLKEALSNVDFAHAMKESHMNSLLATVYVDADSIPSDMCRAALINGYFNLLDTSNGFYNSSLMITQEEYLNAVVKATAARKSFSYTDSESITEQELIANSLRAKYNIKTGTYITVAEAQEILSKELGVFIESNAEESGENLTRGEAMNLIVNTMIENSGIAEEFIVVEPEPVEEPVQPDNTTSESYNEPAQTYSEPMQSYSGYSMSEEERQALLDKLNSLPGAGGSSAERDQHLTYIGEYQHNAGYIPGMENVRLH